MTYGVNSIPFVFFYNEKDFAEVVTWLKNRPDVTKIAIHAQQINDAQGVKYLISDMQALQSEIDRDLHFVVVGVFAILKCGAFKRTFPRLTVVTSAPLHRARCGERLLPSLESEKVPENIQNSALAVPNINTFRDVYLDI